MLILARMPHTLRRLSLCALDKRCHIRTQSDHGFINFLRGSYSLSHMTLHFFTVRWCTKDSTLPAPPCPPASIDLLPFAYQRWQLGMFRA
jgi:hypothetical protein